MQRMPAPWSLSTTALGGTPTAETKRLAFSWMIISKHVQKALDVGVDIICAQGGEGGGHTGDVPTTVLWSLSTTALGGTPTAETKRLAFSWMIISTSSPSLPMNMIGHPKHVQKALDVGVDIICAQGGEGGGHTGDGTVELVDNGLGGNTDGGDEKTSLFLDDNIDELTELRLAAVPARPSKNPRSLRHFSHC
jgi:hypothetical protein